MEKDLYQWNFVIDGLLPSQVKLKRKVWLRKGELLLEKKNGKLIACLLDDENSWFHEKKIIPYLWMSCLITHKTPDLKGGGGFSIASKDEFGKKKQILSTSVSISLPEEAIGKIENYAHKFLGFIRKLHDKYIDIATKNEFLAISLEYFYEAEKKLYSNESLINAVISMEALFNEGPSDIKYKLSHRAGFLLGLSGIEPIEAFEKLKGIYDMRSKLVHGGGRLPNNQDSYDVSGYTRRAIIIFLILLKNKKRQKQKAKDRKKNILKEIDLAMLDEDKSRILKKEILKGLRDFKLPIPRTFEGIGKNGKYRVTAW